MIVLDVTVVNVALPVDPGRPRLLPVEPRLGRQRLPDRLRRPAAARRPARRPDRPPHDLPRRPRRLHRRVAALRPRAEPGDAGRRALRPGRRRRDDLRGHPRHDRHDVPRAARAGEGDRRLRLRRLGRRLGRPARRRRAHRSRSTGTGSSSSTSRSASPPPSLARRLLERDAGIGFGAGADVPGAVLITGSLMLGVYTIVEPAAEHGWGSRAALGLGAGSLALLVAVRRARGTAPPTRSCRCASSARATSSARTSCRSSSVAGMFGMFFLGALYLERVLGYDALQIGLAFLPVTIVMGTLSLRYSERLVMRFGARTVAAPRARADRRRRWSCSAWRRSTAATWRNVLPVMILLGAGAGMAFPALMTLAMSGATNAGGRRPRVRARQHVRAGRRRARPRASSPPCPRRAATA